MSESVSLNMYAVTFKQREQYCIINARSRRDAKARAVKEFGNSFKDVHKIRDEEEFAKSFGVEPVEISPVEVSYAGWNESELPSTNEGGVRFTETGTQDKES